MAVVEMLHVKIAMLLSIWNLLKFYNLLKFFAVTKILRQNGFVKIVKVAIIGCKGISKLHTHTHIYIKSSLVMRY